MANYSIVIQWSDEDGGYIAMVPEFPSLSAFGETPEKAVKELAIARRALIEVYEEDGCPLPESEKLRTHSGQTRIRIEKSLHSSLAHEAKKEGVSLNAHINSVLERRHSSLKLEKKLDALERDIAYIKSILARQAIQQLSTNTPSSGSENIYFQGMEEFDRILSGVQYNQ